MNTIQSEEIDQLKERLRGQVFLPGTNDYDGARKIWNAMIDKRPALIVRCLNTDDVVHSVNFAREQGLPLAMRGGGHNISGSGLCDDGLVADLSQMKSVNVDTAASRAIVEGGATLADFDSATQFHGLATPLGINSTTGVGGLTLGGGFGWLSRKFGMTIDSLESAEVVTAAGEVLRASATEHPDLFWALRGGGGNFGVVTKFEFRLHALGPQVFCGLIVYPLPVAKPVLQKYRDFMTKAPEELTVWAIMRQAPPLPFLPEWVHGMGVLVLAFLYTGDPKQGEKLIEPLRKFSPPLGEHVGVQPYVDWQKTFDPLLAPGARNYWKSHNFLSLKDGLLESIVKYAETLPSPQCEIFFGALGCATTRPQPDATAYVQRDAQYVMNVHGRWEDPAQDQACVGWARKIFKAAAPFATGGAYVNFLTEEEGDRVRDAYGQNYERLAQIKSIYDPDNFFRINQNIKPAFEMAS